MTPKPNSMWEDKEVLFDLPYTYLKLRVGEKIFDRIEPIEDTKGNNGTKGRMIVTNLRVLWHSLVSPRINLSIGLNCVLSTSARLVNSGLKGTTQALFLIAVYRKHKYEFIFTNLFPNCVRHYTTVINVHKSYTASRLYRDIKLRTAIIQNNQLKLLNHEKIFLNKHSVWNLSSDTGSLGFMIATNIRVVWYADLNDIFNITVPYIAVENITIKDSKFGQALVISTRPSSGGYVLGFRLDPIDQMKDLLKELLELYGAATENPILGVEVTWKHDIPKPIEDDLERLQEIGEPRGEMGPNLYLAAQLTQNKEINPVYCPYLGLAIEPVKEGFSLKSLFEVQTSGTG